MSNRRVLTGEGLMMLLGRNLRRLRSEKGLTVKEAAARGGIGPRQWQKAETGEMNVKIETIAKLCAGLDVDVVELFTPPHQPHRKS